MHDNSHLILSDPQVWVVIIGAIVPLGGYVLNRFAPWADETIKAIVQIALAAVASGLYSAIDTNVFGFNVETLQLVLSGVVAALVAHGVLWKPAKVNLKLGATDPSQ